MLTTNRGAVLRRTVDKLLLKRTLGEDYGYDLGPCTVQTPKGLVAGYMLILSCRSPVLSPPRMAHSHFIPDPWPSDELIENAIRECLTGLAAARNQLLGKPVPQPVTT